MAGRPEKKWRLHTPSVSPRTWKIQMVAAMAGIELDIPKFTMGESNQTPEYRRMNPINKVPVLETPEGAIFESNAIVRFLADQKPELNLFGKTPLQRGQVESWLEFSNGELGTHAVTWLLPILYAEKYPFDGKALAKAQEALKRSFDALNFHLETRTYLVGERVTLADIVVACTVAPLYQRVLDPRFRAPFINVNRWFECISQKGFFDAIVSLPPNAWCVVPQKAPQVKKEKGGEKKKEEAKPEKEAEPEEPKEEKPKDPLAALPKSSFVIDEFKREFSNNPLDQSLEYLYKAFDAEGWTFWYCNYKYNDELTMTFMSTNLIGGWFQRMDRMRKYSFGVAGVFGDDSKSSISGVWIIRGGAELPQPMKEVDDVELYEWTPIKWAEIDQHKAKIRAYLNGDDIDGKPLADGKTFK